MTAGAGRSLVQLEADSSVTRRGTPLRVKDRPTSAVAPRATRGRESMLQKRYRLAMEDIVVRRDEVRDAVRFLLPAAQRLHYTAQFHGLHQAEQDAAQVIARLQSLDRRHGAKA